MNELIIQLIGMVAVLVSVAVWQVNKRKLMLWLKMAASLLFALHFFLLSAHTGSGMNVVNAVRFYVFSKKDDKKWAGNKIWFYVFVLISWGVGIWAWEGYISLFPIVGTTLGIVTFWQSNIGRMRWLALAASPLWFVYNVVVGSYPGMLIQVLLFISGVVGIQRFTLTSQERVEQY